ncbi:unnamed protein product [Symbiodinium microadriaticum]|nr:unnamed protein product [Symbiodinium microadriaticum]
MDVVDPNENPYVAVAGRKSRNLRKKLEKIMKIEAQKMEGLKPLNDEQLVLLTTKGSVEKALHDIESIKTQLEDVARDDTLRRNREIEQLQAALQEARAKAVNVESSTCTIAHDRCSSSCEEKHRGCRPGNSDSANHGQSVAANQDLMKLNIYKLLKLFHVCTRYPLLTGNDLPPDIVYFGKCLMGEPSTSGFKETLQQSTRNAELYLDEYMGSKYEAIRGMSYVQIADIIDSLAAKFDTHAAAVPPMATQQAPPPQINFYSDEDVVRGGAVIEGAHRDDFVNKLQVCEFLV